MKISDNVEVIGTECGQPEDLLVDRGCCSAPGINGYILLMAVVTNTSVVVHIYFQQ